MVLIPGRVEQDEGAPALQHQVVIHLVLMHVALLSSVVIGR
jgi:hypothetical protein